MWTDSQNALKMHFTGTLHRNYMLKLCDLLVVLELLSESFMPVIIESFFFVFSLIIKYREVKFIIIYILQTVEDQDR